MSKTVLVVDDEEDVREFLSTLLEDEGYRTLTAEEGERALEIVRKERPDLVILDLLMPYKTGAEFYQKLSQDDAVRNTPVIVVSALPGRHLAIKGSVAVFDKPIDPRQFSEAVRKALA